MTSQAGLRDQADIGCMDEARGGLPTTDETLRRQQLWTLTSGSPGEILGAQD